VHFEHRARDLVRARRYAERSRQIAQPMSRGTAVEHRLRRLRRKLVNSGAMLLEEAEGA
jgi:hypothetical protein